MKLPHTLQFQHPCNRMITRAICDRRCRSPAPPIASPRELRPRLVYYSPVEILASMWCMWCMWVYVYACLSLDKTTPGRNQQASPTAFAPWDILAHQLLYIVEHDMCKAPVTCLLILAVFTGREHTVLYLLGRLSSASHHYSFSINTQP